MNRLIRKVSVGNCVRGRFVFRVVVQVFAVLCVWVSACSAQSQRDVKKGQPLALQDFRPRSMLVVPETKLTRAKFPVVDVHTHPEKRLRGSSTALDEFVKRMDANNIAVCISLDARLGEYQTDHLFYLEEYSDRFVVFAHIDWQGSGQRDHPTSWACNRPEFVRNVCRHLRSAKRSGISGLKLFKGFGLSYRNVDGTLIRIDDRRWDAIWQTCAKLGFPVLIHTADPAAFFQPVDATNERWEELRRHPDWSFYGGDLPSRESLLEARNRVISRHPNTTFIGAHVGNKPEDLQTVASWLDEYPNLFVELASRIGELGRQPYSARRFLMKYADRVLFGTDGPWPAERLHLYWRFLETRDEYFPYSEKPFPPQGLWHIYGVGLEDALLRKIYFENACRIFPGLTEKLAALKAKKMASR